MARVLHKTKILSFSLCTCVEFVKRWQKLQRFGDGKKIENFAVFHNTQCTSRKLLKIENIDNGDIDDSRQQNQRQWHRWKGLMILHLYQACYCLTMCRVEKIGLLLIIFLCRKCTCFSTSFQIRFLSSCKSELCMDYIHNIFKLRMTIR